MAITDIENAWADWLESLPSNRALTHETFQATSIEAFRAGIAFAKKGRVAELTAAKALGWVEGADAAIAEWGISATESRLDAFYRRNPSRSDNQRREVEQLLGLPPIPGVGS